MTGLYNIQPRLPRFKLKATSLINDDLYEDTSTPKQIIYIYGVITQSLYTRFSKPRFLSASPIPTTNRKHECKFSLLLSPLSHLPRPSTHHLLTHTLPQIVEWAFGKRMTPAERLRKHQRSLEKTQRELDRERTKLENQEKKLIQEIKKSAKNGQMGAAKIQAKDLVRTRRYVEKFYSMRTQLQAISLRIQVCFSCEGEKWEGV